MATKIRLGSGDAALVFRRSGLVDGIFPIPLPPGCDEPQNVLAAQALLWAYGHEATMTAIVEAIEAEPEEVN